MRNILYILSLVLVAIGCEKETTTLSCNVISSEVEAITATSANLTATVDVSDYEAVTRMGFAICQSNSSAYDYYDTNISRIISLKVENLNPDTEYKYLIYVRTADDGWQQPVATFKTLAKSEEPDDDREDDEGNDDDEETPAVANTYRAGWFELPAETDNDADGIDDNVDSYYYAHHLCGGTEKNAQRTGTARNYSVCFSSEHHCPVWVAAPRHKMYSGSTKRTDAYAHDPQIPSNIQYNSKSTGGGCNKGHMLGSAERTSSTETNRQVFYYTNIAPQYSSTFNTGGGAWNNLESHIDKLVCADTLYTVIGCYFDKYTDKYGNTGSPKKISFGGRSDVSCPTMFYYALLRTKSGSSGKSVKECSTDELQCAAFVICHEQAKGHKPEARDLITIEELEALTGFRYFDNVPNAPKSALNTNDWL